MTAEESRGGLSGSLGTVECCANRDDDLDPDTPDTVEPIFLPSGKVDVVVPFVVFPGEETEVLLDFDAALSVHLHQTGSHKYILRPVINGSRR